MVSGCRGYVVAGLIENKTKPSSWGLAEVGNKLLWAGVVAVDVWCVVAEDMWWRD